jgi:protein-S-isoprenylcysteine O-methyltransferase Ste14
VPVLALWLWLLFGLLAFALRVALHVRRTGESGLRGLTGRPGSVEWLAGVGVAAAIAAGVAAPALALSDDVEAIDALDTTAVNVTGLVLYGAGLAAVLVAQGTMGGSWRVGVDPAEQTALVTKGPFSIVRNPIYTAMLTTVLGLAMLFPSVVSLAAVALLVLSLEVQTRVVEEPYLRRAHGEAYERYATSVGRFLPGIGQYRDMRRPPSGGLS